MSYTPSTGIADGSFRLLASVVRHLKAGDHDRAVRQLDRLRRRGWSLVLGDRIPVPRRDGGR